MGWPVLRVDEVREAEFPQPLLDETERMVGQENRRLLVDVLGEELHVEVIEVGVGDEEVVGVDIR